MRQKMLFLDLETGGLDWQKHAVLQVAGIVDIDGKVAEEFEFKVRPFDGQVVEDSALAITGFKREEVFEFEETGKVYLALKEIFDRHVDRYKKEDKFYITGQNVKFDYEFFKAFWRNFDGKYFGSYFRYHTIDLVAVTAFLNSAGVIQTEKMNLEYLTGLFGIEHKPHDAMSDIRATRDLYYKYIQLLRS